MKLSSNLFLFVLCSTTLLAQDQRTFIDQELGLPKSIEINVQARWRAEGQHDVGFVDGNNHDFALQRLRAGFTYRPSDWFRLSGEMQDSRSMGFPNPDPTIRDTADLRQAFVGLGRENGWFDVKVGRQAIAFGSERLIGASDWTNTARVFDAVKLGIHHGLDRVDIFSSSVVQMKQDAWDQHKQGDNLHGFYGNIGSLIPGGHIEPYVLWRVNPRLTEAQGIAGKYNSWTYGTRLAGVAQKVWNYEAEILGQHGTVGTHDLRAWSGMAQVRRDLPNLKWNPALMAEYAYASGGRDANGTVHTLDQLYPTNHSIYGVADIIGRKNAKDLRGGVWVRPRKWLTLKFEGHDFRLANKNDGLYGAGGAVSVAAPAGGARSTHVGDEMDFFMDVKISRHYSIGSQWAHLWAGDFLKQNSPGSGRTFYAVWVDFRL